MIMLADYVSLSNMCKLQLSTSTACFIFSSFVAKCVRMNSNRIPSGVFHDGGMHASFKWGLRPLRDFRPKPDPRPKFVLNRPTS